MPPPQLKAVASTVSCTVAPSKRDLFLSTDQSGMIFHKFVVVDSRKENSLKSWLPKQLCPVKDAKITITNSTKSPVSIPKDVPIVDISHTEMKPVSEIITDSN